MAPRPDVPPFLQLAGQPVRWLLLRALAQSDRRVRELVECVDEPQNLVSYHLRLLRDGGLVTARRSSHDGRDTYYHLDLDGCADGLAAVGATLHPALDAAPTAQEREPDGAPGVLFVCTGNSARSPIAEAILRNRTEGRVVVASAGVVPKDRIHPYAERVLRARYDIDLGDQVPRGLDDVAKPGSRTFGRVVTLCDKARERVPDRDGWRRAHWSVPDPADRSDGTSYARFVAVADDIDARVRHLVPMLDERR